MSERTSAAPEGRGQWLTCSSGVFTCRFEFLQPWHQFNSYYEFKKNYFLQKEGRCFPEVPSEATLRPSVLVPAALFPRGHSHSRMIGQVWENPEPIRVGQLGICSAFTHLLIQRVL